VVTFTVLLTIMLLSWPGSVYDWH